MNNVLLYLGALLAVTLAALFAVPHFVDWNGYRGVFEEEATKVLGRDVRVGGAVNVQFLPTPYVKFEKVRLADPTGQTGEPFVRIDSFMMRLSGPALLRGVLEANEIELQRPVLNLALDGKGGGNWTSIQIKPGALPFVPQDVALRSVKLIDGAISLFGADAQPVAKMDAINGEFSADALAGPFKFKGQANWSGEPHDIKFATTVAGSDGAFRIKANVRATRSAATYLLDGNIEDLIGRPSLTGELTGKLPLDGSGDAGSAQANSEPPVLDLKSHIAADTAGAKVEDIVLSLDNATEPQLISGTATAVWGKEQRLDIALASKWLDLDRLAGAGQGSASFAGVKRLGLSSLRALAGEGGGIAGAKIDVDQVKLGGETAGGLKINAEGRGALVRLKELKAGLPGGSRLDVTGDLKDDNGKVRFSGSGFVHGSNLARLLTWASKSGAHLDIAADGAFSAEGRLVVDDARFEFTEASAEIGGRPFSGDVVVSGDGRRKVAVTLEGARLDSSELFPETSRALEDNLRRAFGFNARVAKQGGASAAVASEPVSADKSAVDKASAGKPSSESGDISVRVLAGELKHGDQVFRNVDATVGLDGGSIRIPSAKFTTASGLVVALDGLIDNVSSEPKGILSYDIAGRSAESLNDFAVITGLNSVIPPARLAAAGSAKLAGLVHLGTRGAATADVSVDGTVELAYISGHAEFDGGLQGWRSAPSRIRLTAHAPALMSLLGAFGIDGEGATQPGAHEAELAFAASGPIASGSAAMLQISAPGFDVTYNGTMALPADGVLSLAGTATLKADDILDAMAVAGLSGAGGLSGLPVEGDLDIKRQSGTWNIATRHMATGSSVISGSAQLTTGGPGPAAVSADIHAGTIVMAGLLSAVSGKPAADAPVKDGTWPGAGFAFDSLSAIAGDVRVAFDSFLVQPGIALHQGSFKLQLGPGKVALSELTGRAAGGKLTGTVQLTKSAAGVGLDGAVKLDGADLSEFGAAANGKAGLDFKASAQAQSPAALIAALSGDGTVTLEGAKLPVPGPATGTAVVAAVIANKVANQPGDIADSFRAAAQVAVTELGSRKIPFVIADGVAKLQPITLDSSDGSVSAVTVVDLSLMAIDSAWRVAPFMPPLPPPAESLPGWVAPPAKGALPPASIVYTGRLADLKSVTVSADAADLQRELAVRMVERNLEELERLKQQDQQRVRAEQARRQSLEAERAAAAAAAKAAATGQVPAPPMPPVIPEAAGTAGAAPNGSPAPQAAPPAAVSGASAPPAQQGGIAIEPDPQATAAEAVGASVVPAAGAPRPQPVRTAPPRPATSRRTSSDEVLRSLGGIP